MLDIKRKMLLTKDTIDFLCIYVGHKNENVVRKRHNIFSVGHKNEKKYEIMHSSLSMLDIKI